MNGILMELLDKFVNYTLMKFWYMHDLERSIDAFEDYLTDIKR